MELGHVRKKKWKAKAIRDKERHSQLVAPD